MSEDNISAQGEVTEMHVPKQWSCRFATLQTIVAENFHSTSQFYVGCPRLEENR